VGFVGYGDVEPPSSEITSKGCGAEPASRRNSAPGRNHHVGSAEYLNWLRYNDYPLAPVEEVVTKAKDADEVYDQHLADEVKE
jgi:hypothetical protein